MSSRYDLTAKMDFNNFDMPIKLYQSASQAINDKHGRPENSHILVNCGLHWHQIQRLEDAGKLMTKMKMAQWMNKM